jgi:transposase-like protein
MEEALEVLGRELAAVEGRGRGKRYAADLKHRVSRAIRLALRREMTVARVAELLGLPQSTIRRWGEESWSAGVTGSGVADGGRRRVLLPAPMRVRVVSPEAEPERRLGVTLVSPTGWRVEGVSTRDVRAWVMG